MNEQDIDVAGDRGIQHGHDEITRAAMAEQRDALRDLGDRVEAQDREALAARVMRDRDPQLPGMADDTEVTIRRAQATVAATLASKRDQRDRLNAEIKELVGEAEVLDRAAHVFDRWRDKHDD